MPDIIGRLQLVFALPPPGQCDPVIVLLDDNGDERGRIPTAEPAPRLPFADATVASADARDMLEHVQDEQTWLAELARVLVPDGELLVRVPLENLMAWADALNIYRYISDTVDRGRDPAETLPIGWHRHYPPAAVRSLLTDAGFKVGSTSTGGVPVEEVPQLAGLIVGNLLLEAYETERRLFGLRQRLRNRPRLPLPRQIAARMTVRAKRSTGDSSQDLQEHDASRRL